jgi:MFS transporter, DHA1 family, tetracycline resistance protein
MARLLSTLLGPLAGRTGIIAVSVFLNFAGFTIIIPVLPFSIGRYVPEGDVAAYVSIVLAIYALCSFIAAPFLGAMSDRFGRRPILIFSLLGSALGFVVFGIGGALWVLVLGRIIEGLTAGSISAMYAYVADTHPPEKRGAAFGLLGAAGGLGFMCGPALGGLLGQISLSAPLFGAAVVMVANALWVVFAVPESHAADRRASHLDWRQLNPLGALTMVLGDRRLRLLFGLAFCFFGAAVLMQSNFSVFLKDVLGFDVGGIGWVLFGVGLVDILSQGFIAPRLLDRLPEGRVAIAGLAINGIGFLALAALTVMPHLWLLVLGMGVLTLGDGLVQPALNAMISKAAPANQQGRVQGANQSQQAIARMVGPLASAALYAGFAAAPYIAGGVIVLAEAALFAGLLSRNPRALAQGPEVQPL